MLRPGGSLLVTTPNRLTFSPGAMAPANPFHSHEFTAAELSELLSACGFTRVEVIGLSAGPRLRRHAAFVAAQLAAPPDEWSAELAHRVAAVSASDFLIARGDPDTVLNLVAVARI